jgi:hypothetical protein
VLFHDVAFHDVVRSRFVLSALAYLSQTADRPVVDLRGAGDGPPTRRINFNFFATLIFFIRNSVSEGNVFLKKKLITKSGV